MKEYSAYWYKPGKPLIKVPGELLHVEYVIDNPGIFNIPDKLINLLQSIEDPLDQLSFDREILATAVRNGWLRVHKYVGSTSVVVYLLNKKTREAIFDIVTLLKLKDSDEILIETESKALNHYSSKVIDRMTVYDILLGKLMESSISEKAHQSGVIWFDSKTGRMLSAPTYRMDHKATIIEFPEVFGFPKEKIETIDPYEAEKKVLKNGWWRVHMYPKILSIDLYGYNNRKHKNKIYDLIVDLEISPDTDVVINDSSASVHQNIPASNFLNGEVYESLDEIVVKDKEFGDPYWYHPSKKKLIRSKDPESTHGSIIFEYPKEFGLTKDLYNRWIDDSGFGAQEYMVKQGWFRIHANCGFRGGGGSIVVEVNGWNDKIRSQIYDVLELLSPANRDYITVVTGGKGMHSFLWGKAVDFLFESKSRFLDMIEDSI